MQANLPNTYNNQWSYSDIASCAITNFIEGFYIGLIFCATYSKTYSCEFMAELARAE